MAEDKGFTVIQAEGYTTLKLNGQLVPEQADAFTAELPRFFEAPFRHVVVNCANLSGLAKQWVRPLLQLERELKAINMQLRFIQVPKAVSSFLKNEGVDSVLKTSASLREALIEFGLVTRKALDTDFVNPFLDATLNTLKVQCSTEGKPGKIFLKTEKGKFTGDVSGVIGLVSESFNGSVVISFPEATFLKVMSRMLGEEFTSLTQDVADGAGELTNIIFGQAKVVLNEKGYGIKTALPSVISGKDHSVSALTKGPIVVVPFETDVGPFFVEICLSS